jgi:hypothetical protein
MALSKSAKRSIVILLVVVLFIGWYALAANYDYGALAGTYVLKQNGESCTLHLHPDRTFSEELIRAGSSQTVEGTWHRYGEAHVSFSSNFLKVNGEELNADGEAHGQFDKTLGLFPSLTLAPITGGPTFHKKLFR